MIQSPKLEFAAPYTATAIKDGIYLQKWEMGHSLSKHLRKKVNKTIERALFAVEVKMHADEDREIVQFILLIHTILLRFPYTSPNNRIL